MSVLLALLTLAQTLPARADIDESAYEAGGAVRDEQERQRLQKQFKQEAEAERYRVEAEEAMLVQAIAEAAARAAARPYPERLTQQQCTLCHPAENYTNKHHTWLYWRLVVSRMVWLNEASIPLDAQATIASHLAAAYPARGEEIVTEYGLPAITLALLTGVAWGGRRFLNGRK